MSFVIIAVFPAGVTLIVGAKAKFCYVKYKIREAVSNPLKKHVAALLPFKFKTKLFESLRHFICCH